MDAIDVDRPHFIALFCVCSLFKTFNLKIHSVSEWLIHTEIRSVVLSTTARAIKKEKRQSQSVVMSLKIPHTPPYTDRFNSLEKKRASLYWSLASIKPRWNFQTLVPGWGERGRQLDASPGDVVNMEGLSITVLCKMIRCSSSLCVSQERGLSLPTGSRLLSMAQNSIWGGTSEM